MHSFIHPGKKAGQQENFKTSSSCQQQCINLRNTGDFFGVSLIVQIIGLYLGLYFCKALVSAGFTKHFPSSAKSPIEGHLFHPQLMLCIQDYGYLFESLILLTLSVPPFHSVLVSYCTLVSPQHPLSLQLCTCDFISILWRNWCLCLSSKKCFCVKLVKFYRDI